MSTPHTEHSRATAAAAPARLHSLVPIALDRLTASDLRDEATPPGELTPSDAHPGVEAYRAHQMAGDYQDTGSHGEVLVLREAGRIGICWGGNTEWADIGAGETAEQLVEMYLSDGERYAARV